MRPDPERPGVPGPFDCDECRFGKEDKLLGLSLDGKTDAERRALHCGYMDESEWTGPGCKGRVMAAKPSVGYAGIEWTESDCPGLAVRSPLVVEVSQAYAAMDAHALGEFFPGMTNVVAEGLLELKRALQEYEGVQMSVMKENAKNG